MSEQSINQKEKIIPFIIEIILYAIGIARETIASFPAKFIFVAMASSPASLHNAPPISVIYAIPITLKTGNKYISSSPTVLAKPFSASRTSLNVGNIKNNITIAPQRESINDISGLTFFIKTHKIGKTKKIDKNFNYTIYIKLL